MKNLNWWLMKIDRLSAWVLLFGMFAYFISGYGMTKGLITGDFARWLHLDLFPMIVLVAFALHAGLAIRIAFIRWRIHSRLSMTILFLIFASFLAGFTYVELAYKTPAPAVNQPIVQVQPEQSPTAVPVKKPIATSATATSPSTTTTPTTPAPVTTTTTPSAPAVKTFTATELAKYNGLNGQPAYAAVDGVVYDLSRVFRNGYHQGHAAGKDLTDAFYTAHMKQILSGFPVVGKLVN